MFSHAIILAALSAGALAGGHSTPTATPTPIPTVFATAFASSDTGCTGTPAGNNVTLSVDLTRNEFPALSSCITYAPVHGQNIKLDYSSGARFFLLAYSDLDCKNQTGTVEVGFTSDPSCVPMGAGNSGFVPSSVEVSGQDWQSVQLQLPLF